MWQFAMNSPGNGTFRTGFTGGSGPQTRRTGRLLTLGCFTIIAALHIVLFSAFGFFEQEGKPAAPLIALSLTFDYADSGPGEFVPEAAQKAALERMPQVAQETALPAPQEALAEAPLLREEASMPEPAIQEAPLSEEEPAVGIAPLAEPYAAASAGAVGSAPAEGAVHTVDTAPAPRSVPAGAGPMTNAEYLALIMGLLEQNKIYPLSVRRRGIEGDITVAFTIRRDGSVADVKLADPSGHRFLAQAAFETVRSASPFPAPVIAGRDEEYTAQVRIRYRLKEEGL